MASSLANYPSRLLLAAFMAVSPLITTSQVTPAEAGPKNTQTETMPMPERRNLNFFQLVAKQNCAEELLIQPNIREQCERDLEYRSSEANKQRLW